ncbi:hypothetical protein UAJ10_09245 [Nitrospirillum sp. BR 11164]|uniref:hypothetical protein n=1 Tax=Nitrospirillum sp. BR 11164 TaxID=3104324 RepID=UPI002B002359|nr:hypothetical protein [Nitrospirillum sp. BR 11164]MEA1649202.1 hypothetical protein [Nitrospirillum sp. BR 11164]
MGDVIHFRARPQAPLVRMMPPRPSTEAALRGLLRDIHADVASFHGQPDAAATIASYANRLRIILTNMDDAGGAA